MLRDELFDEMDFNDELFEDICDTINDETWCERDPYGLRESQGRIFMWNEFCQMVKTKMRHVFFRMPEKDSHQEEAAYIILEHISKKVADMKLIEKVPVGNSFYRGRMHDSTVMFTTAEELGSPPNNRAKSNRMSAEGISVFYGADNIKTAISEIYDSRFGYASVAPFVNTKELVLLDLTKIENTPFPSLFDEERREYRETILFLRELNKNLTRPIESMENIEYVPAQIIAEYFRFLYKYDDQSIDGIAYRSSKNKEGICYVLFFDHEQCLENKGDRLFPTTQMMKIKDSEIRTFKVNTDIQYSISL